MRPVCLLVGICACGYSPPPESESAASPIINGTLSLDDKQVFALGSGSGGMFCTSTLIGERTLLTAGHCLDLPASAITASNQADVKGWPADAIQAVETRVHPKYTGGDHDFDVGVVLLAAAPAGVTPKAWNRAPLTMQQVPTVRAVGFGETHVDGSGVRYQAEMWVNRLTATTLYLGDGTDGGTSTCFGDSGGPSFRVGLDGVERVVGVHAFANSVACNGGGDVRADTVADFIDQWTRDKAATCALDAACVPGCTPEDLDCACLTDGVCAAGCPLPDTDGDCPKNCLGDGVCAFGTCGVPDPDCEPDGAMCQSSEGCAGHQCITDALHAVAYCSRTCHADEECSSEMRCSFGVCSYPVLPLATMGEPCTVGRTLCSGGVCGGQSEDTAICRLGCGTSEVCPGTMQCVTGVHGVRYCQGTVVLPPIGLGPAAGRRCSVSSGETVALLAAAALLRRRRADRRPRRWAWCAT